MTDNEKPVWTEITIRQTADDIRKYGPSLAVRVGALPNNGVKAVEVCAQIDTGAEITSIDDRLAQRLALKAIAHGLVHKAGAQPHPALYFRVLLSLPHFRFDIDVEAFATSLGAPHDLVIGRNVLKDCRLASDFTTGLTRLWIRTFA